MGRQAPGNGDAQGEHQKLGLSRDGRRSYLHFSKRRRLEMADEIAVLAGGCFWCTEAVFLDVVGVKSVESGYTGGQTANPTYKQVCGGDTGHAEAIRITFDNDQLSYSEL